MMDNLINQYVTPGTNLGEWKLIQVLSNISCHLFLALPNHDIIDRDQCVAIHVIPQTLFSPEWWTFLTQKQIVAFTNLSPNAPILKWQAYGTKPLTPQLQICYLVREYALGGTLDNLQAKYPQNKLPPEQAFLILQQLISVVQYAQQNQIIHGFIQLKDWYLTPQGWKLGNFGLANLPNNQLGYFSPEVLKNNPPTFKSDIWSLGVCAYALLTNTLPYKGENAAEIVSNIERDTIDWPLEFVRAEPQSILGLLFYLIRQMLQTNPNKRPQIDDISQALLNCMQWIKSNDHQQYAMQISQQLSQNDHRPKNEFLESFLKIPSTLSTQNFLGQNEKSAKRSKLELEETIASPPHQNGEYNAEKNVSPCIIVDQQYAPLVPKYKFAWGRFILILLLLAGLLVSLSWHFHWDLPWWSTQPKPKVTLTFHLQAKTEVPDFCWRIGLVTDSGAIPDDFHKTQWRVIAQHQNGKTSELLIDLDTLQQNNLIWEVPLDMPDGFISLQAKAKILATHTTKNNEELSQIESQILRINIEKSFAERQSFSQAETIGKQLEQQNQSFSNVIQAYQTYLNQYPNGYFKTKVLTKIQELQNEDLKYQYNLILSLTQKQPPPFVNIVSCCEEFLAKYSDQIQASKVKEIQTYYSFFMTQQDYSVTLVKGGVVSFWQADTYVKVFVSGKEVLKTTKIPNQNNPRWDLTFKISWKTGETIAVEFWDYDPMNSDDRYFRQEDSGPMAIQLLNGRIGNTNAWLEFASSLPQKTW